jgi:O-antigen/teichoic acid export membrane protein
MFHLAVAAPERMRDLFRRSVAHLVMAALPVAVGGAILARHLMVFVFGAPYATAGTALAILLLVPLLQFPGYVTVTALYACGLERRLALILPMVLVGNVGVNVWAIQAFGIEGAAGTTLGTDVLTIVLMIASLRGFTDVSALLAPLGKPLVATAAMAAAVWPIRDAPLLVPISVGALVYVGVLFATRVFGPEDRQLLRAIATRAPRTAAPTK